jgi:RNA polymerase sigma-70 factor (ECF subfamily)
MNSDGGVKTRKFEQEALIHLDVLYGTAIKMTQDKNEAEDLVQETCLRAYKFFHLFESGTNCKAWLLKIMTNLFINRYNKKKSEPDTVSYDERIEYYLHSRVSGVDYVENPQFEVEWIFQNLLNDDVKRLLSELPENFRTSIILCDIQGFSYADVAEATNVNIGTVKSRLFRARRRLQRGLWEWATANGYLSKGRLDESSRVFC